MTSGRILHIQRLSTEDGPGIRSTVFFKGCPLHCAWCHNPESISMQMQMQWYVARCIGCNSCVDACPTGCITQFEAGLVLDREGCDACGKCIEACPSGAREMLGRDVTVEEVVAELLKDRAYYEKSGGGVTLSGGEPTFQPDFAEGLLSSLKDKRISTALDTCGLTTIRTLDRLLPFIDLVLFDMKILDPVLHNQHIGAGNQQILENLLYVRDYIKQEERQVDLWIRTPLIAGVTGTGENLSAIGRFLSGNLDGTVGRWELCTFNNLCRDQYSRLGLEWKYASTPLMSKDEVHWCEQAARTSFTHPELVRATGATRLE